MASHAHTLELKNSQIFNPTQFWTELPNFLHANISAFTVYHVAPEMRTPVQEGHFGRILRMSGLKKFNCVQTIAFIYSHQRLHKWRWIWERTEVL